MGGARLSRYKNFHSSEYLETNSPLASCITGISRKSCGLKSLAVQIKTFCVLIPASEDEFGICFEWSELATSSLFVDILSSSEAEI